MNTRRLVPSLIGARSPAIVLSATILLAGCGGGGAGRERSVREVASGLPGDDRALASRGGDAWPTGLRRVVQAMYYGRMSADPRRGTGLADQIGSTMQNPDGKPLPSGIVAGLSFSPASNYGGSYPWDNALRLMARFPSGRFILTVHLGHQATEDRDLKGWAKEFYDEVFASSWSKGYFVVSPGNEYKLDSASFDAKMRTFANELKIQWKAGSATKGKAFPTARLRFGQYQLKGERSMDEFTVEGEYHLLDKNEPQGNPAKALPSGYTLASNDGQTVGYRAYSTKTKSELSNISASDFNGFCGGANRKNASLWLPQFHLWAYDEGKAWYTSGSREEVSGARRTSMLSTLAAFMKSS